MKYLFSILFLLSFVFVNAQANDDYYNPNDPILENNSNLDDSKKEDQQKPKIKYNLTAGTSIGSGLSGGSAVNTWIAPSILYPVNEKFSVEAGVMYNKGFYNNYKAYNYYGESNGMNSFNGNTDQLFFYAKGRYKLTDKLTITGTVYKSTVINNNTNSGAIETNPNAFNLESNGYSFGFIYKMTENSTLEFQMNYNKGASPYYSPMGHPSPFGGNSMGFSGSPFGM